MTQGDEFRARFAREVVEVAAAEPVGGTHRCAPGVDAGQGLTSEKTMKPGLTSSLAASSG